MTREFVKSDSNQSSEVDRWQFQLNGGMLLLRLASAAEDMPVEPRPVGGQERAPGEYSTKLRFPIKVGRRRRSICPSWPPNRHRHDAPGRSGLRRLGRCRGCADAARGRRGARSFGVQVPRFNAKHGPWRQCDHHASGQSQISADSTRKAARGYFRDSDEARCACV
jgi:hypothetical protein